jgi:hypothetical protein
MKISFRFVNVLIQDKTANGGTERDYIMEMVICKESASSGSG